MSEEKSARIEISSGSSRQDHGTAHTGSKVSEGEVMASNYSQSYRSHSMSRSPPRGGDDRNDPHSSRTSQPSYNRRRSYSRHRSRSRSRDLNRNPNRRREEYNPRRRSRSGSYNNDNYGRGRYRRRSWSRSRSRSPYGRGLPFRRDRRSWSRDRYGPYPPYSGSRYESRNHHHNESYGPPHTRFPTERERQRGRRDDTPAGVSLLVRNITSDISVSDLRAAFARIGQLKDVYIPMDYHSQKPKGFAFIEYATPEQARMAQEEMDKFLIKGRRIEVVFAQERRKTPGEMRFKGERNHSGSRSGDRDRSNSLERYRRRDRR